MKPRNLQSLFLVGDNKISIDTVSKDCDGNDRLCYFTVAFEKPLHEHYWAAGIIIDHEYEDSLLRRLYSFPWSWILVYPGLFDPIHSSRIRIPSVSPGTSVIQNDKYFPLHELEKDAREFMF